MDSQSVQSKEKAIENKEVLIWMFLNGICHPKSSQSCWFSAEDSVFHLIDWMSEIDNLHSFQSY
jgi:hypothetical protein